MSSKKYLFLHVGLPKCASSSLQVFFALNSAFLLKNEVLYPEIFSLDQVRKEQYGQGNAYSLAYSLLEADQKSITICSHKHVDLAKFMHALPSSCNVLLSSEWFTELRRHALEEIHTQAKRCGFVIFVFYFYRDIIDWNVSEFKQAIKMGKVSSATDFAVKNPFAPIGVFEEVFGAGNVKGAFLSKGADVFKRTLEFMKIEDNDYHVPEDHANQALSDIVLRVQMKASDLLKPLDQRLLISLENYVRRKGLHKIKMKGIAGIRAMIVKKVRESDFVADIASADKNSAFGEVLKMGHVGEPEGSISGFLTKEEILFVSRELKAFMDSSDLSNEERGSLPYIFNSLLVDM